MPSQEEDCDLIIDILTGRGLLQRSVLAEAREQQDRADRLTVEQATILKVTRLINRVEVRGGVGSGMTLLAIVQANSLNRARHGAWNRSSCRNSAARLGPET
ncbi:hypothetical protein N802_06870 [Knoellia sinensis KCTC 19936]|uniref:Uncharacterized protein n=1 Tax=Knoellia sinensis KCTC 19936 TaxID=1385520 RepID=A0A0A0J0G3_9MICO|nr:hypothetical protein [Knoellia sinensis]KGN30533.1 hypothetical protein N802_06870 [Knoellia sinensis KCTC 19936]